MKDWLLSLLSSKKFLATLVSVLVWILGRFGFDLPEAELLPLVGAIAAFVLAQGLADHGKEAVKEASKALATKPAAPADPP